MKQRRVMKLWVSVLTVVLVIGASFLTYYGLIGINPKPPVQQNVPEGEKSPAASPVKVPETSGDIGLKVWTGKSGGSIQAKSVQQPGEKEINPDEYEKITALEKNFLISEASGQLPYQRVDITLKNDLSAEGKTLFQWKGQSNRPISLYAWDYKKGQWTKLEYRMEREIDGQTLQADMDIPSFFKNKTARILLKSVARNSTSIAAKIPKPGDYDYTIAWMTDTQYYSDSYPEIYTKITRYIADHKKDKKIAYAIHTGDLVNNGDQKEEWTAADKSMKVLDEAEVPYGVLAGNHDVLFDKLDYTNYWTFFGEKRFKGRTYYGGSMKNNKNHYDLISAGSNQFIILYFGWKVDEEAIDWANKALKEYPDRKAILCLHSYIAKQGTYYDGGGQVMEKVIKPNENVFMVTCGHFFGTQTYTRKINNRTVYELFFNTQSAPEGGEGYFRLLHFDEQNGVIYVNTYSPHLDDYNYYDREKDQFVLPFDSAPQKAKLATDLVKIGG
ncbi:MAG: metallophosphoesterase [Clostridia bacterium]|nr:metallophosphoesterase [Clostridia bacterium]